LQALEKDDPRTTGVMAPKTKFSGHRGAGTGGNLLPGKFCATNQFQSIKTTRLENIQSFGKI